jgi:virulence-associated protein VagC
VLGNSLALIIDKPLRRALNIGRTTPLDVRTDGRRLIIEPVAKPTHDPHRIACMTFEMRRFAALETGQILIGQLGPHHMHQLGWERRLFEHFMSHLDYALQTTPQENLVMDRLEHLRAALDAGHKLDEAIQIAVAAVPSPSLA